MTPLHVLVTMDVEPVRLRPEWTGPVDAEQSHRYLSAYRDLAHRHGFPVSFFIHPEAAALHAAAFRTWEQQGDCLGLHVHATKYRYPHYRYEFGYYDASRQREILTHAAADWTAAIGAAPTLFRPGAFSANDATFAVLADLGYRGCSCSIPGRVWPQRYCVWAGAPLFPHRTHAAFRQAPGSMDLVNIPLSVVAARQRNTGGYVFCQDLRPCGRDIPVGILLQEILDQVTQQSPCIPVIHLVTHNDQPFDQPDHESTRRFTEVLTSVGRLCKAAGLEMLPSTVKRVVEAVLALPPEPAPEWHEDNNVTS